VKDFKAVHGIARSMNVWYVANESPYRTINDLIAAGKAKPQNVGTYSAGYQLAMEWLAGLSGAKLTYVPYKGQAQVINDVIGRQLDAGIGDMGGALPLIQGGRVRAIAVSGESRHPGLPNVPTVRETYPEYENYAWTSFYVRSDTPPAIHAKLVDAMKKALQSKEAAAYFAANGSEPMLAFGPEEMTSTSSTRSPGSSASPMPRASNRNEEGTPVSEIKTPADIGLTREGHVAIVEIRRPPPQLLRHRADQGAR